MNIYKFPAGTPFKKINETIGFNHYIIGPSPSMGVACSVGFIVESPKSDIFYRIIESKGHYGARLYKHSRKHGYLSIIYETSSMDEAIFKFKMTQTLLGNMLVGDL